MEVLAEPRNAHVGLSNDTFVYKSGNRRASLWECGERVVLDGILNKPLCQGI